MNTLSVPILRVGNILTIVHKHIFRVNFWGFYLFVLAVCLSQNGIWYSSFAPGYALLSQNLTRNPLLDNPGAQWALTSFLGPVLASFFPVHSPQTYALFQLGTLFIFFPILILLIRRQYGDYAARAVLILFLASPVSTVLLTWLGSPDVLTFLLSIGAVLTRNNPAGLFLVSILLGANHPEQGGVILGLIGAGVLFRHSRRDILWYAVAALGGWLVGVAAVQWWFQIHNFGPLFTRTGYVAIQGLGAYVGQLVHAPLALLLSLFGSGVLFVTRVRSKTLILQSAIAFLVVCLTFDQTRVFSLLTFPALMLPALSERQDDSLLALTLLIASVLPRLIVHGGIPHLGFDLGQTVALHFR